MQDRAWQKNSLLNSSALLPISRERRGAVGHLAVTRWEKVIDVLHDSLCLLAAEAIIKGVVCQLRMSGMVSRDLASVTWSLS